MFPCSNKRTYPETVLYDGWKYWWSKQEIQDEDFQKNSFSCVKFTI